MSQEIDRFSPNKPQKLQNRDLDLENEEDINSENLKMKNLEERKNFILNIIIIVLLAIIFGLVIYHHYRLESFRLRIMESTLQKQKGYDEIKETEPDDKTLVIINKEENQQITKKQEQSSKEKTENPLIASPSESSDKSKQATQQKSKQNQQIKPSERKPLRPTPSIKKMDRNDFEKEQVYQEADEQMKAIFDEMISRQSGKVTKMNKIFMPTQKAYFAYRLFKQPNNERYLKAEYYYYDKKYAIGSFQNELPICIVSPGRNLVKQGKFKRFFESVARQNYTNYKIVYIDDVSDDDTPNVLQQYLKNNLAKVYERITIVKNTERVYALANRNNGIRNYCKEEDIVLDVDADDAFIGNQAFKFVNAIYHDDNLWQSNSVFIYMDKQKKQPTTGPQDGVPQDLLDKNAYRGSMVWKTSELRTFRAKLFNKIDENDFKDEDGKFYRWASDVFMQEPLVQLASQGHYKHLYEILYFYDWNFDRTTVYKRRHYRDIAFTQTRYKPLQSLDDKAEKVEGYVVPEKAKKEYEKNLIEGRKEAAKYKRQKPF